MSNPVASKLNAARSICGETNIGSVDNDDTVIDGSKSPNHKQMEVAENKVEQIPVTKLEPILNKVGRRK